MKIGMFDSGLGGLTVLREVTERLPGLSVDYFGDTARVPYGNKSGETILRYSREIAGFLLEEGISLLVIACNTASAYALKSLEEELPIPVVGVIEPGALSAAEVTRSGQIAVLATKATVRSGAYVRALKEIDPSLEVTQVACPLLVPLIEENALSHPAAELILKSYLEGVKADTLLLGCTHYPLLMPLLKKLVGEKSAIVDSASTLAKAVEKRVGKQEGKGVLRFFASDDPERFQQCGAHFMGRSIPTAELVEEFLAPLTHPLHS